MNASVVQNVNLAPLSFNEIETIGGGVVGPAEIVASAIVGVVVDYLCNTAARNASFVTGFRAGWNAAHP